MNHARPRTGTPIRPPRRSVVASLTIGLALVAAAVTACTPATTTPGPNCGSAFGLYRCLGVQYGGRPENTAQIVRQDGGAAKPVIIVVHGGAWTAGAFDASDGNAGPLAGANDQTGVMREVPRGYAVMAINYRLATSVNDNSTIAPGAVNDVKLAVRWVRANGLAFGLDPGRIALWGHSAGGHLVTLAGSSSGINPAWEPSELPSISSAVTTVISFSGVYDFNTPISYPGSVLADQVNQGASMYLRCATPGTTIFLPACTDLPTTWASPRNLVSSAGYTMTNLMLVTSQGNGPGDGVVSRAQPDVYSSALAAAGRTYSSCDNVQQGGPAGHATLDRCNGAVDSFLAAHFPA